MNNSMIGIPSLRRGTSSTTPYGFVAICVVVVGTGRDLSEAPAPVRGRFSSSPEINHRHSGACRNPERMRWPRYGLSCPLICRNPTEVKDKGETPGFRRTLIHQSCSTSRLGRFRRRNDDPNQIGQVATCPYLPAPVRFCIGTPFPPSSVGNAPRSPSAHLPGPRANNP